MEKYDYVVAMDKRFVSEPGTNPKHDVSVGLAKQRDPDGEEHFWLTVWGEWGSIKDFQFDLEFESKGSCVAFLKECVAVLQEPYGDGAAT